MTKTKKQRAEEEDRARIIGAYKRLGAQVICRKCGATLDTFNDACDAPLDEMCDGFVVIELAHYPDGRNVVAYPEEQIAFARSLFDRARADHGEA